MCSFQNLHIIIFPLRIWVSSFSLFFIGMWWYTWSILWFKGTVQSKIAIFTMAVFNILDNCVKWRSFYFLFSNYPLKVRHIKYFSRYSWLKWYSYWSLCSTWLFTFSFLLIWKVKKYFRGTLFKSPILYICKWVFKCNFLNLH